jgi:outer membrane receptor for ferrienterochelin and colicins
MFVICLVIGLFAQEPSATVRVEVRAKDAPVAGAAVVIAGASHVTDQEGIVRVSVPPGKLEITIAKDGFVPATASGEAVAGEERAVTVDLVALEEEVTVIASTRTERRIEDQPMRVEVLAREEIEEKMLMTPGDIVMMLNEMGGMRVQATSPSLGAASVRIQGMRGRYTRFLSDGLPLFGEQPGGLGLLQIPPMDLGQVEVIKGVASALYGAGAMGGVVNLISRRPGKESVREALINRSTRGATDAVLWLSAPLSSRWAGSLLAGGHWQEQTDVNGEGWSDLPGYSRAVVRPRILWDGGNGRSFFATAGATWEDRTGGTQPGSVLAATGEAYREALDTRRFDVGALGQALIRNRYVLTARAAVARQRHDHEFGETRERDRHDTAFGEIAIRGTAGRHTWVAGTAIEHDRYAPTDVPWFAYSFTTPGLFAQDDVDVRAWLSVSVSARADFHNEYGAFFSPRVSAFARSGEWTTRVSVGRGFFAATPLTEETEAAGLSRLTLAAPLRAERGTSASLDVTRTVGPASITGTLFASRIANPIEVDRETYVLGNLDEATTNSGAELLGTLRRAPFALTGTYTYVRSRETERGGRFDVALTPRHSAGVVAMAESEDVGRVGVEVYFTGRQRLDVNPYRDESEPYVILGLLGERRFGRLRLFVNGENLTGVRQTRWDPLLRPTRAVDGRWTVDAWAPLDGRTINGGLRVGF